MSQHAATNLQQVIEFIDEDIHAKWFGQEIVCAEREQAFTGLMRSVATDHHHRGAGSLWLSAQAGEDRVRAHTWQVNVEQNEVGALFARLPQTTVSIESREQMPRRAQIIDRQLDHLEIGKGVFDVEQSRCPPSSGCSGH